MESSNSIDKYTILESRDAEFFDNTFFGKREHEDTDYGLQESVQSSFEIQIEKINIEPRRSKRSRTERSFGPDLLYI